MDWGVGHYERTAKMLLPAARVLVEAAAIAPGERVLDLGSGTGNAALLAAAAGAHVVAVDPSARLLGVAAAAAKEQGLSIRCEQGEAGSLPLPDSSCDCVLSNFGVIFAPSPEEAADEIARVLAPRGRFAFTAWLPGGAAGALSVASQKLVRDAIGAPQGPPGLAWHDESEVSKLFNRRGMSLTTAGSHELAFTAPSPEAYLEAERDNHPLAVAGFQLLRQLGKAEAAQDELLRVVIDHNEDPAAFRSTSRYLVFIAQADST